MYVTLEVGGVYATFCTPYSCHDVVVLVWSKLLIVVAQVGFATNWSGRGWSGLLLGVHVHPLGSDAVGSLLHAAPP